MIALAAMAAAALVQAVVTDGWEGVRHEVARLFGRGQPGIQLREQALPACQQGRPGRQRHWELCSVFPRRLHVGPDRGAADGGCSSRPELAGDPGPG